MLLGTLIKRITSGVGIPTCAGCEKRREKLDAWSRRGFIGSGLFAALVVKNEVLRASWKVVGAEIPLNNSDVLGFLRTANMVQAVSYFVSGTHQDREDMLIGVASHREHFAPSHPGYAWMSKFTPAGNEVLPGWTLNFARTSNGLRDFKNGYRIVLSGERSTFITDELGVGYRAPTPTRMPNLKELEGAASFPGAVGIGAVGGDEEPTTGWQRIKGFFTPTEVYAQSCCTSRAACLSCGCLTCISVCCSEQQCTEVLKPNTCTFNTMCGTCVYYQSRCGLGECTCCAMIFKTCCFAVAPCSGSCRPCLAAADVFPNTVQ
jgi:hypothetical protein